MELSLSTDLNTMEHKIFDDKMQERFFGLGNPAEQIRMFNGTRPDLSG